MGYRRVCILACAMLSGCLSAAGDRFDRLGDACSGRSPRERDLIAIAAAIDDPKRIGCAQVSDGDYPLFDLGLDRNMPDKRYWVVKFTPANGDQPIYTYIDQGTRQVVNFIIGEGFPPKQPQFSVATAR